MKARTYDGLKLTHSMCCHESQLLKAGVEIAIWSGSPKIQYIRLRSRFFAFGRKDVAQ